MTICDDPQDKSQVGEQMLSQKKRARFLHSLWKERQTRQAEEEEEKK